MAGKYYTKSGFGRRCGVNPSSINYAIKSGTVVEVANGDYRGRIDITDPVNVAYFERSQKSVKSEGKAGRPIAGAGAELKKSMGFSGDEKVTANEALKIADVRLKGIKIKRAELDLEEHKRNLIPIAWIARRDAEMSSILEDQFRQFDSRVGEELCDIAQLEDPERKVLLKKKLRDEIDSSMQLWKSSLIDRMEKMLA